MSHSFDEFFASRKEESASPFLTADSKRWGIHLSLKGSCIAAICLVFAFGFSSINPPLSALFLSFVFFLAGIPALIEALKDLKALEINIDTLMTAAAFLALFINSGLEGGLLLVLFGASGALEETVSSKALSALHNLNHLAPKSAQVVADDGMIYEKSILDIKIGMKLLIKAGEIVPLDGIIAQGETSVNLSHLTGESLPDFKTTGDEVPAGAKNLDAAIVLEVKRISSDSTISRIVSLIMRAKEAKPKLQQWLDRFDKTYATTIIALTFGFMFLLPPILSIPFFGDEGSIYRSLAFLIASAPCALVIATPTAYLSAISACARKGILLKGGITLDALASCTTIAFDKTGTLTTGDLVCASIAPIGDSRYSPLEALGIAAALERHVVHPIATALLRLAQEKNAPAYEISQFKSIPGYGLEGMLEGNIPVAIGLLEHIAKKHALDPILADRSDEQLLCALAIGQEAFLFRFTDQVRSQIPDLIRHLRTENNLTPIMLTGDHAPNAHRIAKLLGIEKVFADLRPEDKLKEVERLAKTTGLAMVGDGVNDAPALARATVGISMGRIGSATAVDASDAILLNDDLHLLGWLFSKASSTQRIVKQNLTLALGVIALATLPALLGLVPLWVAVLLHEGGTLVVGANSLRLLRT